MCLDILLHVIKTLLGCTSNNSLESGVDRKANENKQFACPENKFGKCLWVDILVFSSYSCICLLVAFHKILFCWDLTG